MKLIHFLCGFLILFALYAASMAYGQSLNGDLVRLRPSSLPASCNTGDLRTDSADSYKLKQCVSGSWGEVGGNPLPAYTSGYVLYGDGTDTPVATSGLSFNVGTGALTATSFVGALTGNSDTATALAANPADCGSDTYATTIAANGNLTCASITNAATTGTAVNTGSTLVLRDSSGNFAAGTITAALTGNASTATALASNPNDCSSNQFANAIAASGNLTCAQPQFTDIGGVATIAQGGTNNGSLGVTAGGVVYTDGSKLANTGAGTTGQILTSNGSSAPTWQAAPAGGTNDQKEYVSNGKFETDVTGWTTYDDAAAAPVDGSGGTVTTTFTRTTTAGEVLRETGSGELSKDASNRQGEGVCVAFTADYHDAQGMKPMPVSFEYQTPSSNYASGDVLVYAIDVTATMVQAIQTVQSTTAGTVLASSTPTRWNGVIYPTTTNTSYKLCWHIATTNASAWDMHIDSVHVGNQNVVPGAIVADLGTEAWTDNQANATTSVRLSRIGNRVFAKGVVTFSGAMSGAFTVTIPAAYTPDATEYDTTTKRYQLGTALLRDTGSTFYVGMPYLTAATTITIDVFSQTATYIDSTNTSSTIPMTWANTDTISFDVNWIVSGWAASAAHSTTETMFSTVRARYTSSSTASVGTTAPVDYETKVYDTHNAVTTGSSWRFTAPKNADYRIHAQFYVNGTPTPHLYKNGVHAGTGYIGSANASAVLSNTLRLVKGDYIDIRSSSTLTLANGPLYSFITVEEIPDFSIFAIYPSDRWYINASLTGANPSLGVSAVTSYTEIIDAGLTLTPISGSAAVGTMCSTTNAATAPSTGATTCAAGSESLGINFAIPEPGVYEVCAQFSHYMVVDTGESLNTAFELIETPTSAQTLSLEGGARILSNITGMTIASGADSSASHPVGLCGLFNWASVAAGTVKGVRLMFEQSVSGTADANLILADADANNGQRNMHWRVRKY